MLVAGAPAERAELSGRLRHELAPVERPTVGDWVALAPGARDGELAVIHHVLPRRTVLVRRAAGTRGEPQAVAANVDTFLVVTSANRDAGEPGCAVAEAVDDGSLDPARVAAFHKLEREAAAAARRQDPVAASRSKQRWKSTNLALRARAKLDPKLGR